MTPVYDEQKKGVYVTKLEKMMESVSDMKISIGVLVTKVETLIQSGCEHREICKEYREGMTRWREEVIARMNECPEDKKIEEIQEEIGKIQTTVSNQGGSIKTWMLFFVVITTIITIISLMTNLFPRKESLYKGFSKEQTSQNKES